MKKETLIAYDIKKDKFFNINTILDFINQNFF